MDRNLLIVSFFDFSTISAIHFLKAFYQVNNHKNFILKSIIFKTYMNRKKQRKKKNAEDKERNNNRERNKKRERRTG